MRRGSPQGRGKARGLLLCLAGALACLLAVPAGASAADPVKGCTQTNVADPATEVSEWLCFSDPTTVAGYEVKRSTPIEFVPKPAGVSGHITDMEVDVADANGPIPIDRLMLHHIVFLNLGKQDSACGGPERFYGAGEERAVLDLPAGYGYPIESSDTWATTWMYMNHRPQIDKGWVRYTLTIDPREEIRPVRSYWADVGDCAFDPIYNVPGSDLPRVQKCKKVGKKASKKAKRRAAACRKKAKRQKSARAKIIASQPTHTVTKDVKIKQNGFIIAGAGHTHGGAKELRITKPGSCGDKQVAVSRPTWGDADHPFYNVKPVLHEPGPIGMSAFGAANGAPGGIPVRNGQTIRLHSTYDNIQPHARVMGIFVLYLAPRDGTAGDPPITQPEDCSGPLQPLTYVPGTPGNIGGRTDPVPFTVPLTGLDQNGNAIEIDGPPGAFRTLASGATVTVGDRFFSEPNVILKKGATLNYQFIGGEEHNVTLANGPMGIGSPDARNGAVYQQTFTRSGTYRLFCGLHPVQMSERVVVKDSLKKKKRKKSKAKKRKSRKGK